MEEHNHRPWFPLVMLVVLLLFLGLITVLAVRWFMGDRSGSVMTSVPVQAPSAPISTEKGTLTLRLKSTKSTFAVGERVTVTVYGSSDVHPITGYDVSLTFNPELLEYVDETSTLSDFQVFGQQQDSKVSLTGIKQLSSETTTILKDAPMVDVTFVTKKAGAAELTVDFAPSSTADSNLINDKNKDVLGKVEGVVVLIK
jgi:hypothetical protein